MKVCIDVLDRPEAGVIQNPNFFRKSAVLTAGGLTEGKLFLEKLWIAKNLL